MAANNLLSRLLIGRYQIEAHCLQHPDILKLPIEKPTFIIGLPRTGTTILHALLNQDKANRSPLCWECLEPYPLPQAEKFDQDPRIAQIDKEFNQLFKLLPSFKKMHLMSATTPQECIGLHTLDFKSFQFVAQFYIPSYLNWMHDIDLLGQYQFHKKMLQYLQSSGVMGERWLLKSPVHLGFLDKLLEVYPDAAIISTHRHPEKVIPSASSLISSVRSVYSDHEDPFRTGHEQLKTWSTYLDKFTEVRAQNEHRAEQFYEVYFEDFIQDPLQIVRNIYQHFGWELKPEAEASMQQYMIDNKKDKHGAHKYTLEQFGLTQEDIQRHFEKYITFLNQR